MTIILVVIVSLLFAIKFYNFILGAIKFGDPLTLTECKDLLKSLTKCKLPFQCAHGRPSVVPLIQLQNKRQVCLLLSIVYFFVIHSKTYLDRISLRPSFMFGIDRCMVY